MRSHPGLGELSKLSLGESAAKAGASPSDAFVAPQALEAHPA